MSARTKPAKKSSFKLGVQDDNVLVKDKGPGREWGLDRAKELGAKVVRVNIIYGDKYEPVDALIASAAKRGIKVQLTITGKPAYGYSGKDATPKISADKTKASEFGAWAKEVAQHFKGRVGRYSVWNEPNHPLFLKSTSARAYVKLYRAAQGAIKSVDPKAQVMVGELAPSKNAENFVRSLAKHGIKTDGIAMHPYQAGAASPRNPYPEGKKRFTISNMAHMQRVLRQERKGLSTKHGKAPSIYATEFGYRPDEPNRGRLLQSAINRAKKSGVRQLVLYQLAKTDKGAWDTSLYGPGGEDTEASIRLSRKRQPAKPKPQTGGAALPTITPVAPPVIPGIVY